MEWGEDDVMGWLLPGAESADGSSAELKVKHKREKKGVVLGQLVRRYPLIYQPTMSLSRPQFDCVFIDGSCVDFTWAVNFLRPTSLLVISVEGTPPALKQRLRGRDLEERSVSIGDLMGKVSRRLHRSQHLRQLTVVATGSGSGEAEHNIFDFIRRQREAGRWNENATICICTPDTDSLFLALQNNIRHCCLLNTSGSRLDGFIYVDVLREYFLLEFGLQSEISSRFIDDFVLISFLFGNDFIRHLEGSCSWSEAVRRYRKEFVPAGKFLVDGDSLDAENFSEFVKSVSISDSDFPDSGALLRHGSIVLDQILWIFHYYKSGVVDRQWVPDYLESVHMKVLAQALRGYRPRLHGSPTMNDFQVVAMRAGSTDHVLASEVRFEYRRKIAIGIPPCFPTLLAIPPVEIRVPISGDDDPVMQVRQAFPIKESRVQDAVGRILLVGGPYLIPAKVVSVVRDDEAIRNTVDEFLTRGQLDMSRSRALFGVQMLCQVGRDVSWKDEIEFVPIELTLPIDVTNTLDRFRNDLAFQPPDAQREAAADAAEDGEEEEGDGYDGPREPLPYSDLFDF
jgi:hypothetical protein